MKYDSVVYADPMPNWIVVDVERYGLFYSVMDRKGLVSDKFSASILHCAKVVRIGSVGRTVSRPTPTHIAYHQ